MSCREQDLPSVTTALFAESELEINMSFLFHEEWTFINQLFTGWDCWVKSKAFQMRFQRTFLYYLWLGSLICHEIYGMIFLCLSWSLPDTILDNETSHKVTESRLECPVIRDLTEFISKACLFQRHREFSVTPGGEDRQFYQFLLQL